MTVRVSCPFCNSNFNLAAYPPNGRTTCTRCGESVPVKAPADEATNGALIASTPTSIVNSLVEPTPKRRSRGFSVRLTVLAVLAMGLTGLGIGLWVNANRANQKPDTPETETPLSANATPPVELAGLGYLPPDCNLLLAIQPGPLLANTARTNQDPRDLLSRAGVPGSVFTTLDRLGIGLAAIDHIVVGTRIGDSDQEIRLAVVLSLRRAPADEEQFLQALEAKKQPGAKNRYSVKFAGLPMLSSRVSGKVWVFGLDEKDLAVADAGGGKAQLSPGLKELLGERLPPDAAVWIAADSDRWAAKPLVKLAVGQLLKRPELLPVLAQGQAAAAGWSFGESPRLRIFVRCVDSTSGEKLRAYFTRKATAEGVRTGGGGEWAMFEAPADPNTGLQSLRELLDDVGK